MQSDRSVYVEAHAMLIEVRYSTSTGHLALRRDGPGALPDVESCWNAVAPGIAASCHLEIQVDILAGELFKKYIEGFFIWLLKFRVLVRDIWTWRPGFYSELRYGACEHTHCSGLAWRVILKKYCFHIGS